MPLLPVIQHRARLQLQRHSGVGFVVHAETMIRVGLLLPANYADTSFRQAADCNSMVMELAMRLEMELAMKLKGGQESRPAIATTSH